MDDDPESWLIRSKRRGALTILALGVVVLVPATIWLVTYWAWGVGNSPITYVRVVGTGAIGIGAGLTAAGTVMFTRARRLRAELIPRATLVARDASSAH